MTNLIYGFEGSNRWALDFYPANDMQTMKLTQGKFKALVEAAYKTNDVKLLRQMATDMGIREARTASAKTLRARLLRTRLAAYAGYAFAWSLIPFVPFTFVIGILRKKEHNQNSKRRYLENLAS